MRPAATITEAQILQQLVAPTDGDLPSEAAKAILCLKFSAATTRTIRRLLRANNEGSIAVDDRLLLEKYLRVGQMLDLMHAKAHLSLRKNRKRA